MSITDELREWWVRKFPVMDEELHKDFTAIANRIDTEHERAIQQTLMGEGGVPATDENMAEHGWIRLPKDADGEYIRVGDEMDSRVDYLFDGKPFTVRALVLCEDGWEVADGRFGNRYEPDSLRHHHAPTVEDMLREFAGTLASADNNWGSDVNDAIAKYAAKLRLAEEDA